MFEQSPVFTKILKLFVLPPGDNDPPEEALLPLALNAGDTDFMTRELTDPEDRDDVFEYCRGEDDVMLYALPLGDRPLSLGASFGELLLDCARPDLEPWLFNDLRLDALEYRVFAI